MSYEILSIYRTEDYEDLSPEVVKVDWNHVVKVICEYREREERSSGYGHLNDVEFADIAEGLVPTHTLSSTNRALLGKYLAAMTIPLDEIPAMGAAHQPGSLGIARHEIDSIHGFTAFATVSFGYTDKEAHKLLVGILNRAVDEMQSMSTVQYYYHVQRFDISPFAANNFVAGTLTAGQGLKVETAVVEVVKPKPAGDSVFL